MANPVIKMYNISTLVGTPGNPIDLGVCPGGEDTELSYDILLYNDKGAAVGADDAYTMYLELIRLYVTQDEVSDGNADQEFTVTHIPVLDDEDYEVEVVVDGTEWTQVSSFVGYAATDTIYTINFTTGVITFGDDITGKIPPNLDDIAITYTPDLNVYGKEIEPDTWVSAKSNGVTQNTITVTKEVSTTVDADTVDVLHYPEVTGITGVYDNAEGTGTNYYTSGSYGANTGRIILGSSLPAADTPVWVDYTYQVKDDGQGTWTAIGNGVQLALTNRLPSDNAKHIQLKVSVPATADTESSSYLKVLLRVVYLY